MKKIKRITGKNEAEIWKKLEADFKKNPLLFQYSAKIRQNKKEIILFIDIDLGGGFEGGYAITRFTASVASPGDFHFAIHPEGLLEKVEKFFGMQDITIGYPLFDKKLIIKSNDGPRVKKIFSDKSLRDVYSSLSNFSSLLQRHVPDRIRKKSFLELSISEGVTNPARLKKIFNAFSSTLKRLQ